MDCGVLLIRRFEKLIGTLSLPTSKIVLSCFVCNETPHANVQWEEKAESHLIDRKIDSRDS